MSDIAADIPRAEPATAAPRRLVPAIRRGLARRCPACGEGACLRGYLKARDCERCGEPLGSIRADDLPPYITILIVGHIIVPLALLLEKTIAPSMWVQMTLWTTATLLLTLGLLPWVKGGAIGLFWALRLRGDEHQ